MTTVRVVSYGTMLNLARRSENTADLLVDPALSTVARDGVALKLPRNQLSTLIALLGRRVVDMDQLVEAVYGDAADGGPLTAQSVISGYLLSLRSFGPLIGVEFSDGRNRKYEARVVPLSPPTEGVGGHG